jgi:DNA-binding GntR family transcriptional regulator
MNRLRRTVIRRPRLREQVYDRLRKDIAQGAFAPGQRIVETDVADRYGVSRTPVPHRGCAALAATPQSVIDAREIRALVVSALTARAAGSRRDRGRQALAKALSAERVAHEAGSGPAFAKAGARFVSALRAMCGNKTVARLSALLDEPADPILDALHKCSAYRKAHLAHHAALFDAVGGHDPIAAAQEVRRFAARPLCSRLPLAGDEAAHCAARTSLLAAARCGHRAEAA